MKRANLDTPLGPMIAVGDETRLYYLDFRERPIGALENAVLGRAPAIDAIEKELQLYFEGRLQTFQTALCIEGTAFQKRVWQELRKIPYGQTISYAELAAEAGSPSAQRAAGSANGANRFAIVIPCHRVIQTGGGIGGYGGGLERKKWLLAHECKAALHGARGEEL